MFPNVQINLFCLSVRLFNISVKGYINANVGPR